MTIFYMMVLVYVKSLYACTVTYIIFSFSLAMREDRYFIAGRAIAISLVHGGPPPGFLSPTLFSSLVDGPELAKPVLEDIADRDLHEKIKRVIYFLSFTICCGLCLFLH